MKTKVKFSFIILLFLMMLTAFNSNSIFAGSLFLNNLEYYVNVKEDASIDVTEIWDIDIQNTNTLFKTFEMDSEKFSSIDNVKVKDITNITNEKELDRIDEYMYHVYKDSYYAMINSDSDYEIAWGVGLDYSYDTRKYEITYTVHDAVALYNDCAELYWQFLNNESEIPIKNIYGKITFENPVEQKDILVWGHTASLRGNINANEQGEVVFSLNDIPAKNMVEIRTTFPRSAITSSNRTYEKDIIPDIEKEEKNWAFKANLYRLAIKYLPAIIIALIIFVIIMIVSYVIAVPLKIIFSAKKKIVPTVDYDYFREVPREDATPAQAYALVNDTLGTFVGTNIDQIFPATIMDLNLKELISFTVEKDVDGKDEVTIKLKENSAYDDLPNDEKYVYSFLKDAVKDKNSNQITMEQLQEYIKENPSKIDRLESNISSAIREFIDNNGYIDKEESKKSGKLWYHMIIVVILAVVTYQFILPIILAVIVVFLDFIALRRVNNITQKGVDEIDKWKALKKFMNDFSNFDEKELPSIVIWEKYLVYATAFGMADKVIDQLKIVYPDIQTDNYLYNYGYSLIYISANTNFNTNVSKSIKDAINSYRSSTSSSSSGGSDFSSGSGGGGGFSSGGGGGGGGGSMGGR